MSWYYARGQEQLGPVEDAEFERLVVNGQINAQTLVWRQGMADWQPYEQLASSTPVEHPKDALLIDELPAHPVEGQFRCTVCGNHFPESDLLAYQGSHVCAQCKTAYFQRIREGVTPTFEYAGFWIRVGASILDGIIQWVVTMLGYAIFMLPIALLTGGDSDNPLILLASFGMNIFSMCFGVLYETWFIGKFGATPGKMACGLKVIKADGSSVSYLRALGRHFAKMISVMILFIGYIMVAFDDQKRGLHDYICDTRVVRK